MAATTSQISFRFTLAEVTPGLRPAWAIDSVM
jgi:hypothetical protein